MIVRDGIPTVAELRAIGSGYRSRGRADLQKRLQQLATVEPDQGVLDILSDPFTSIEDTHERLIQTEEHLREHDDRRSVFLTVYATMTGAVQDGIQSGFFDDAAWVREYLVTFAEYYRRALVAFERRDFEAVPLPWQIGLCTSIRGDSLIAQDALLGINAHINYDLTYTLRDVSIDPNREAKRADHDRINDILAQLIDVVQDALVTVYSAAGVSTIDDLLGRIDEQLALGGLEQSRSFAWRNAVLLTDLSWSLVRRYVNWRVRTVSVGGAYLVLAPRIDASTQDRLRDAEADLETVASFHDEFSKQAFVDVSQHLS